MTHFAALRRLAIDLESIDFGFLSRGTAAQKELALRGLEQTVDLLQLLGIDVRAGDLAIRYFLTDPEKSRQYLYGPTDVQDGVGLIPLVRSKIELLTTQ